MGKGSRNRSLKLEDLKVFEVGCNALEERMLNRKFSDSIKNYIVCMKCMEDKVDYLEQGLFRRVGTTDVGLDVFCELHGLTLLSIDFKDVERNLKVLEEGKNSPCPSCGDMNNFCETHN